MRIALIAPCIITDDYQQRRNEKWLAYYSQPEVKKALGITDIWLVDNASPDARLSKVAQKVYNPKFEVIKTFQGPFPLLNVLQYEQRFERRRFQVYHYWYRACFSALQTIRRHGNYDKILFIDTDVYILKKELAEYLKNLDTGWNALWCARHNFADTTMQILCKDSFPLVDKFIAESFPIEKYDDRDAEGIIPFTNIIKQFRGDRFGELRTPQDNTIHYYGQCGNDIQLVWEIK